MKHLGVIAQNGESFRLLRCEFCDHNQPAPLAKDDFSTLSLPEIPCENCRYSTLNSPPPTP